MLGQGMDGNKKHSCIGLPCKFTRSQHYRAFVASFKRGKGLRDSIEKSTKATLEQFIRTSWRECCTTDVLNNLYASMPLRVANCIIKVDILSISCLFNKCGIFT